jgi:hypothetical protein
MAASEPRAHSIGGHYRAAYRIGSDLPLVPRAFGDLDVVF